MKLVNILFILVLMHLSARIIASNDPCAPTQLMDNPAAVPYENIGFGNSAVGDPPFGDYAGSDFWFSMNFIDAPIFQVNGLNGFNPAVAIYDGDCNDPRLLYNIVDNNCDGSEGVSALFNNLTPGTDYLIRVWNEGGGQGTFEVQFTENGVLPQFQLFGDATMIGDCIQLTANTIDQRGCAYFDQQLDFSQPFTREMVANFGDNPGGADGITLVFQSNNISACGNSGSGIGAETIPNSFIVEFDTWQNGITNDPFFDHTSININGNMNHALSINGPVSLPNGEVEDGLDHNITFSWEPSTMEYAVIFDGVLLLSGNFDIINNCFGGSNMAFWGYTSSTGGFSNEHVICPDIQEFLVGEQVYQEAIICEGASFMGYDAPGFYIDFEPGPDNCQRQINTYIEVTPTIEVDLLDTICQGDVYAVGNETFANSGDYEVILTTPDGCDSTVHLSLFVIDANISGSSSPVSCLEPGELRVMLNANITVDQVDYTWTTPSNDILFGDVINSTEIGTFTVTATFSVGSTSCQVSTSVQLNGNFNMPELDDIGEIVIPCDGTGQTVVLGPTDPNILYGRILNGDTIPISNVLTNLMPGEYVIIAIDAISGCSDTTSFDVTQPNLGDLTYISDTLTCADSVGRIALQSSDGIQSISWSFDNIVISNDTALEVTSPGIYSFELVTDDGCISSGEIIVQADTLAPELMVNNDTIDCIQTSALLTALSDPMNQFAWFDEMDNLISSNPSLLVDTAGSYTIQVRSPENGCSTMLTTQVIQLIDTPATPFVADTLFIDCDEPIQLNLGPPPAGLTYRVINGVDTAELTDTLVISSAGNYTILVINEATGCSSETSFQVLNSIQGGFTPNPDTIDCSASIHRINSTTTINIDSIAWTRGGDLFSNDIEPEIDAGGLYSYFIVDENGCIFQGVVEVIEDVDPPQTEIEGTDITCADPASYVVTSTADSFAWLDENANLLSPDAEFSTNAPGVYIVVTVNRQNSCSTLDTIEISDLSRFDTLIPSVQNELTCQQTTTTISAASNNVNADILWTTPDGTQLDGASQVVEQAGFYVVQLTNEFGCVTVDSIEVISALDTLPLSADIIHIDCVDSMGVITLMLDDSQVQTQEWMGSAPFTLNGEFQLLSEEAGTFEVEVTSLNGCVSRGVYVIEDDRSAPMLTSAVGDSVIYDGSGTMLEVSFDEQNMVFAGWIDDSDLDCQNPNCNPAILGEEPLSSYTYLIVDSAGCEAQVTIRLVQPIPPPLQVYVPSAFSPNNDGINDIFTAFTNDDGAIITSMQVFNRWGGLVFGRENLTIGDDNAQGWDGTSDGEALNPSVFGYQIEVLGSSGERLNVMGEVQLVR